VAVAVAVAGAFVRAATASATAWMQVTAVGWMLRLL
jgi:hypothetical protein